MILWIGITLGLFLSGASSRSISRYGPSGNVNLVEFNIRGVVYGRCVYTTPEGEEVSVMYEERDQNLKAKSSNPTVLDPLSKAQECRDVASKAPTSKIQGRTNGENSEQPQPLLSQLELYRQFVDFNSKMASNRAYVYQLQPRFIGTLFNMGMDMMSGQGMSNQETPDNIGVSFSKGGLFGGSGDEEEDGGFLSQFIPGITLHESDTSTSDTNVVYPSTDGLFSGVNDKLSSMVNTAQGWGFLKTDEDSSDMWKKA
ncbi:UNVERIFIED_CONTAM: hypothetical protein RMT77_016467 [Armadillidium vulgare]